MEKFDFESAVVELKRTNGLLCVYKDFLEMECPQEDLDGKEFTAAARVFVSRASMFDSVIDAAQDKILALCDKLNSVIEEFEVKGASV